VVLPDLHGDLRSTLNILIEMRVIDKRLRWTAVPRDTVVVQLGDQLDGKCRASDCGRRPDSTDDIRLLKAMSYLHVQAVKSGGAVFSLLGNHEVMNCEGDLRFVSRNNWAVRLDDGRTVARKQAFQAGSGPIALFLARTRLAWLAVGTDIFVHAGLPRIRATSGSATSGSATSGSAPAESSTALFNELAFIDDYVRKWLETGQRRHDHDKIMDFFWSRRFSGATFRTNSRISHRGADVCREIPRRYRLFVGHTPTSDGTVRPTCDNSVYLTDVSLGFFWEKSHGQKQIVHIKNGRITKHFFDVGDR
jgi:hypothetical protein